MYKGPSSRPLAATALAGIGGASVASRGQQNRTSCSSVPRKAFLTPSPATRPAHSLLKSKLRVRPLMVDGKLKEWTNGESHAITDRSSVVRRALRLNDALPGDKAEHWIWQRGPWLLVGSVKGSITALHLPDYDPAVSNVVWFRDYAAYCGLTASGKQLYAVVAQIAARKPVIAKKLSPCSPGRTSYPPVLLPCALAAGAAAGHFSANRRCGNQLQPDWTFRRSGGRWRRQRRTGHGIEYTLKV